MKRIVLFMCLVLILAACGGETKQARKSVEGYLDAVKNGDDYDAESLREGLIDVFDYEFLKELEAPEVKRTSTYDRDMWEDYYQDDYSTFEEYKESGIELAEDIGEEYEVLVDNDETLEIWTVDEYKDITVLLYNVEIANAAGEKLYKKAEFTLEDSMYFSYDADGESERVEGYVVTDIQLR